MLSPDNVTPRTRNRPTQTESSCLNTIDIFVIFSQDGSRNSRCDELVIVVPCVRSKLGLDVLAHLLVVFRDVDSS
jgi:hypothetical protein